MHKDEKGKWQPNYVIKSPRECESIIVYPKDLKYRVLMIYKEKRKLKGTAVLKYIEEGERKAFHRRPTCASRGELWYGLGVWEKPDLIWSDAYNDRYAIYDAQRTWTDKRFFNINLKNKADFILYHAYLNSTIIPLIIEIDGITNLGEGAVYTNVYQLKRLLVPFSVDRKLYRNLVELLKHLTKRKVSSIFEEIGVDSPEKISLNKVKSDRRELDKIVMGEILGLTDEEQIEVYRAIIDLVKSRIEKARSVGAKRKTKEGIDIDLLTKTVMDNIGDETFGKFYKEKILSQKNLAARTIPQPVEEVITIKGIFGWSLKVGKKHIDCDSEEEAKYLKILAQAGLEKIKIPKDQKYLKKILPELESMKKKMDNVINDYLSSILDHKLREKLLHYIWQEIMKY
jgi:hypothetical protein